MPEFFDKTDVQVGRTHVIGVIFDVICSHHMTPPSKPRTVYSTQKGRLCPKCGWPEKRCKCASQFDQPVPDRITVRIRIEKAGRKGKTVTVIENLPRNREFLRELAGALKGACGSGGTAGETHVEIQGDHRGRIKEILRSKGWRVKG
jgi:translation initiation factor 1